MSSAPWLEIQRIKGSTIDEFAAIQVIRDIDDAIRRRDVVSLRSFAAEARASGMDQEAARAFEIADVIEGKAGGRDELMRIKAAIEPPGPTPADLVRRYDREFMARDGRSFSVNDFKRLERERAEAANAALRQQNRRHEAQRAAWVARDAEPKGPGR